MFLVWSVAGVSRAEAYTYTFCLRWPVTLNDAGFGEDYSQSPTDPWRARGGRARIQHGGTVLWDGYLNSAGCTPSINSAWSSGLTIKGWSRARVGNNINIEVRTASDAIETWAVAASPGASGTKYYVFPSTARTTILAVAAFALQNVNSGLSNATFTLNDRCRPEPNPCCNCSSGGEIWLSSSGRERKFLITHEIGHRLLAVDH
jgi:hypothetical protein